MVVADVDASRAELVAKELGLEFAPDVDALLTSGLDGFVIAAATSAHADLIEAAVAAGDHRPSARSRSRSIWRRPSGSSRWSRPRDVPVHIGFQRRFDAGYQRCAGGRSAVGRARVRPPHSCEHQRRVPAARRSTSRTSGGFFRDCTVHDFDIIRYVTGREVVSVYATGANRGEAFFGEYGDVDAAAALLTLDDGTFVVGQRYPLQRRRPRRADGGARVARARSRSVWTSTPPCVRPSLASTFPAGPPHMTFMDRFQPAYVAELTAFTEVVAGTRDVPCTVRDALAAFRIADACELSRRENRVVTV